MDWSVIFILILITAGIYGIFVYLWNGKQKSEWELPDSAEDLLVELVELRVMQAEIRSQIEDIQEGRPVQMSIKGAHGTHTTLSQHHLFEALVEEDETLTYKVYQTSLAFAENMVRCGKNGGKNEEKTAENSLFYVRQGSEKM